MTTRRLAALVLVGVLAAGGCTRASVPPPVPSPLPSSAQHITKVLVIAEENHGYRQIIGSPEAPFLTGLAGTYGDATRFDAGYPASCPSLAAYVLITSGSTSGICDDRAPRAHPLAGDNVFAQVSAAGLQWRNYAESAPRACAQANGAGGRYLVRHVPATYYLDVRRDCARWAVPMGTVSSGALHDDITAGTLPAFGFISPDACHDMHGAAPCPVRRVQNGDAWLRALLPTLMNGPDYRSGRLGIIITWDEGTGTDNHIPTVVVAPGARHLQVGRPFTHCSTLRTVEDVLHLRPLGCAAGAASMVAAFHL